MRLTTGIVPGLEAIVTLHETIRLYKAFLFYTQGPKVFPFLGKTQTILQENLSCQKLKYTFLKMILELKRKKMRETKFNSDQPY